MRVQILELAWGSTKATPTAFETHARRLRLQALGTACRDIGIEALLMGHHQDDNVETMLWRLCTGARSAAGLAGIPRLTKIPECNGLYGVSESGSSFPVTTKDNSEVTVSTGGILICRPLLSFPKSSLLVTCHANRIPFVTDPTNFDSTLTPRNAIRSLLSTTPHRRLPRALCTSSILDLIKRSEDQIRGAARLSSRLLHMCKIVRLDLASGMMIVRFPRSNGPDTAHFPRQIQSLVLRRISHLISPLPDNYFPLERFEPFTRCVFGAGRPPSPSDDDDDDDDQPQQAFAVQGVMFRPDNPDQKDGSDNTWFLSRQPFMRHRLPILKFTVHPPSSITTTAWQLWDNRYWFRISIIHVNNHTTTLAHTTVPLTIRPFQQSDVSLVYRSLDDESPSSSTQLRRLLHQRARGPVRLTLPLITTELDPGREIPLALPTLSISFPHAMSLLPVRLEWQWMYKMIDKEALDLMT